MKNAEEIFQLIAAEVGVSPRTVKRTLSQSVIDPRPTFIERAKLIRSLAEAYGYRPNAAARAVRSGTFGQVAMITRHDITYQQFNLNKGVCGELAKHDLHLILAELVPHSLSSPETSPRLLRELCVDGLIIHFADSISPEMFAAVSYSRTPVVWANVERDYDSVCSDDCQGARLATETLLKLGHRRIAFCDSLQVGKDTDHYSTAARPAGYVEAMMHAGLAPECLYFPAFPAFAESVAAARHMLNAHLGVTAWLCSNDHSGAAVLLGAVANGLSVPRDLSVVMFHNLNTKGTMGFPVSTMALPMQQVGVEAVRMLLRKMVAQDEPQPSQKVPFRSPPIGHTIGPAGNHRTLPFESL
jgi:LacI family transcriptional regulator